MPAAKYAGRYRKYNRDYWRDRRASAPVGVCGHCLTSEVKPGCKTCVDCLLTQADGRAVVIEQGLCGACRRRKPKPGRVTCKRCIAAVCAGRRARRQKERAL